MDDRSVQLFFYSSVSVFDSSTIDTIESRTKYRNAFQHLWDGVLSEIPNNSDDIASSLERQLTLRSFNREMLNMETNVGSTLNRVIGMGVKVNPETGKEELVTQLYPSYFDDVVRVFELYPVTDYFGLTVTTAMELPVNQWYKIRKTVLGMPQRKFHDTETELLKIIKQFMDIRTEGG